MNRPLLTGVFVCVLFAASRADAQDCTLRAAALAAARSQFREASGIG